jgi:hypothetical protein
MVSTVYAGDSGDHVQYVGGTISALPTKTGGFINTPGEDLFLFQAKGVTVQIPYEKINAVEYGQRVSRRYAEAVLLSPVFLLSKTRKHYLTVEFTDDRGKQQAMVFLVGKGDVRSFLCWSFWKPNRAVGSSIRTMMPGALGRARK